MKKEHVINILRDVDKDNPFYQKAETVLHILEEDKDYIIQDSRKGIKKEGEIRIMEEYIRREKPSQEKGGVYDQLELVKKEKGLIYHLDVFPKKYWIYCFES